MAKPFADAILEITGLIGKFQMSIMQKIEGAQTADEVREAIKSGFSELDSRMFEFEQKSATAR